MPEVVEGDLRQPDAFQEGRKRPLTEVGGVDKIPDLPGEDEVLVSVEGVGGPLSFSSACRARCLLGASTALCGSLTVRRLLLIFSSPKPGDGRSPRQAPRQL